MLMSILLFIIIINNKLHYHSKYFEHKRHETDMSYRGVNFERDWIGKRCGVDGGE